MLLEVGLRLTHLWRRIKCAFTKHAGQETYEIMRPRWPEWTTVDVRCARCDATVRVEERGKE